MEVQLRELIEQIKKDGVAVAEAEAKAILDAAEAEAQRIIADARSQADQLLANAKAENERIVRSGEDAIRQAGRNLLLSFRESVTRELKAVLGEHVAVAYSATALSQLILKIVAQWAMAPDVEEMTVILSSEELQELESLLLSGMKEKMITGVTLQASDRFDGGFRIAVNNGNVYYDYSAEAVVEMLSNYLSPKIMELMKEA